LVSICVSCWGRSYRRHFLILRSKPLAEEIVEKLGHNQHVDPSYQPFGDGHSADRIVEAIEKVYQLDRKVADV